MTLVNFMDGICTGYMILKSLFFLAGVMELDPYWILFEWLFQWPSKSESVCRFKADSIFINNSGFVEASDKWSRKTSKQNETNDLTRNEALFLALN